MVRMRSTSKKIVSKSRESASVRSENLERRTKINLDLRCDDWVSASEP